MLPDPVEYVLVPCCGKGDSTGEEGGLRGLLSLFLEGIVAWTPTFVPPTKIPPLAPFGPSLVLMAGMSLEGMAFVLQKSAAVRRDTFSSSVSVDNFFCAKDLLLVM